MRLPFALRYEEREAMAAAAKLAATRSAAVSNGGNNSLHTAAGDEQFDDLFSLEDSMEIPVNHNAAPLDKCKYLKIFESAVIEWKRYPHLFIVWCYLVQLYIFC